MTTYRVPKAGMSLAEKRPDLAAMWHPTHNGSMTATDIGALAKQPFWWKCECGNEFERDMDKLNKAAVICDSCKKVSPNALLAGTKVSEVPLLMKHWDPVNPDVASTTTVGSHLEFSWVCDIGHKYPRAVHIEWGSEGKCPICTNRRLLKGFNDLASQRPDRLAEWDYANNTVSPHEILYGYTKPVAWKCEKGHRWSVSPASRIKDNHGCNTCLNKSLLVGHNDLLTSWPEIAKYYDNIKNPKDSSNIGPGNMGTDLWWFCDLGHSYERSIAEQVRFGPKCDICRNKVLLRGFNDLATVNPKLAAEWDEEKNGIAASDFVYKHHNESFWWKCMAEGHSWETYFTNRCRTKQPTNCPYCSNQFFLSEYNSLSAMRPDIAEELDEPDITGWEIPFGSPKNYNWKCSEGHTWNVSVAQRCHNNSGCMLCSKSNTSVIETRLRTLVIEGGLMADIPEEDNARIMIPFGHRKYMRVDIVGKVAGKKCVIEYDSFHWHREKYEIDNRKTNLLLNDGYIVIRIREQRLLTLEDVPASPYYIELLDVHPNSHKGIARIMERVEEALKTIMA